MTAETQSIPKLGPWVVRLPPWLAALVEEVPHGERGRRLEQHCATRATKAGAFECADWWVLQMAYQWEQWAAAAARRLWDDKQPIPPHPLAETMARVPLGRLSPEVKAELARRAAWAGVRTEDYACGVILSVE